MGITHATPICTHIGKGCPAIRSPDPRIAQHIRNALGGARSVLNVGAGTGAYEPVDLEVTALEPSARMIAKRPCTAAPVVEARAEDIPFGDNSFDACLAILTMHHWSDPWAGLLEMRRIARQRVVIFTFDATAQDFWLFDYIPELREEDLAWAPKVQAIASSFARSQVRIVPIPADCSDGFLAAYWRRPAVYLDAGMRQLIAQFAMVRDLSKGLKRLEEDIISGAWTKRYGYLYDLSELDLGYRIIIGEIVGDD